MLDLNKLLSTWAIWMMLNTETINTKAAYFQVLQLPHFLSLQFCLLDRPIVSHGVAFKQSNNIEMFFSYVILHKFLETGKCFE